jgi:hypothetical protein
LQRRQQRKLQRRQRRQQSVHNRIPVVLSESRYHSHDVCFLFIE